MTFRTIILVSKINPSEENRKVGGRRDLLVIELKIHRKICIPGMAVDKIIEKILFVVYCDDCVNLKGFVI